MKLRPTVSITRSMSRELRGIEKKLRELARSRNDEMLDIGEFQNDLHRQVDAIAPEHRDSSVYETIDKLIDAYLAEFQGRILKRHHEKLSELNRLETKLLPYLSQATALLDDQRAVIWYYDVAVANALDRIADPETPITDPRKWTEPRRGAP